MTNINKGKHTPLPWHTDDTGLEPTSWINIYPKNEECLPLCSVRHYSKELKANAKFIVKACSSHYELLEALKLIACRGPKPLTLGMDSFNITVENRLTALQAIQKAEGNDND